MTFFSLISDCLLLSLSWSGTADVLVQKNIKGSYSSYILNSNVLSLSILQNLEQLNFKFKVTQSG